MNDTYKIYLEKAVNIIQKSNYVIALVGAGLSAESGIPTFRGKGGLWTKKGEPGPSQYRNFVKDPKSWWINNLDEQQDPERTNFRNVIDKAKPNQGHLALYELEHDGILKHQITQNVDGLHFAAGSKNITEIHGSRANIRCISCEFKTPRVELESSIAKLSYTEKIKLLPPSCHRCGGVMKPDTVMFGEPIPSSVLEECVVQTKKSDCILMVGTSATVYPAASFPQEIKTRGGKIIELNPSSTSLSEISDISIRGSTSSTIPDLVKKLGTQQH